MPFSLSPCEGNEQCVCAHIHGKAQMSRVLAVQACLPSPPVREVSSAPQLSPECKLHGKRREVTPRRKTPPHTSSKWSRLRRRKPEEGSGSEEVLDGELVRAIAQRRFPAELQSSRATTTALTRRVRGGDDTRCGCHICDGVLVRSSALRKA